MCSLLPHHVLQLQKTPTDLRTTYCTLWLKLVTSCNSEMHAQLWNIRTGHVAAAYTLLYKYTKHQLKDLQYCEMTMRLYGCGHQ